jgi:hypothetical protein
VPGEKYIPLCHLGLLLTDDHTLTVIKMREHTSIMEPGVMEHYGVPQVLPSARPCLQGPAYRQVGTFTVSRMGVLLIDESDRFMLDVASGWAD